MPTHLDEVLRASWRTCFILAYSVLGADCLFWKPPVSITSKNGNEQTQLTRYLLCKKVVFHSANIESGVSTVRPLGGRGLVVFGCGADGMARPVPLLLALPLPLAR